MKHYVLRAVEIEVGALLGDLVVVVVVADVGIAAIVQRQRGKAGIGIIYPWRVVYDLEAMLAGVRLQEVAETVERFFEETDIDMLSVGAADFIAALDDALAKREVG